MSFAAAIAAANRAALDRLGGPISYRPMYGTVTSVTGIFDAAYIVAGQDPGASTSAPAVFFLLADLPGDPDDDEPTITVSGVDYVVAETKRDGSGGVVLVLHRA